VGGAGHVHTTAIFGVTGFPYIVVLRIEEVACLHINSLWLQSLASNNDRNIHKGVEFQMKGNWITFMMDEIWFELLV